MNNRTLLIFDFDGTICDSFAIFVEILNGLSGRYGFKSVATNEIPEIRCLAMQEILDHLEVPKLKIPFILRSARKAMYERFQELEAFAEVPEVIRKLDQAGYCCGCLTSNSEKLVKRFFDNENIPMRFVAGGSSLFGKARLLRKTINAKENFLNMQLPDISAREVFGMNSKVQPIDAFYIGDEIRDIVAAKEAGLKSIAVAWGYNHPDVLKKENPDHLINEPGELMKIFI